MNEYGQPPSRPQAMNGSPEGQVPLALSAQDAPGEGRESRGQRPLAPAAEANKIVRKGAFSLPHSLFSYVKRS